MFCNKCGSEIADEQLFCPHCGHEINLVAEYDMMDDLMIQPDIVNELNEKQSNILAEKLKVILKQRNKEKTFLIMLSALVVSLISLFIVNYNKNQNSADYQLKKAVEFYNTQKYKLSIERAKKAVELDNRNSSAYGILGDAYSSVSDYSNAKFAYEKAIEYETENENYYIKLFELYKNEGDFTKIKEWIENSPVKEELRKKYSMCYPKKPEIALESGVYNEIIKVVIHSQDGLRVFYSMDGSEPDEKSHIYKKAITLDKEGSHILKAVCMNEYGILSETVMNNYEIIYPIPDSPTVNPSTGRYNKGTLIKIITDEKCNAYSSWDGSIPTIHSSKYNLPIKMKKGKRIFTVVAINEYGKVSLPTVRSFEVRETDEN